MKRKFKVPKKRIRDVIRCATLAAKNSGKEICGALIDNGIFLDLLLLTNKTKKGGSFSFYTWEWRLVEKFVDLAAYKIVGTFHSHPTYFAEPGPNDIKYAKNDSLMLIIDVMDKDFGLWYIKDRAKKKLLLELI